VHAIEENKDTSSAAVLNSNGNEVLLSSLVSGGPAVLIFLRQFG